jgi:hypothetical protein
MGDGVAVKLDVNQLITQVAQAFHELETSSMPSTASLCEGGKVIGSQEGIHWDSLTGWEDEVQFLVTSREYSNNGSNIGIWDPTRVDILCSYQKGGGLEGHGKFLQNINFTVHVTTHGGWGTGGTISGHFHDPANRGSHEDPIAELTAEIVSSNGNNSIHTVTLNGETGHHISHQD